MSETTGRKHETTEKVSASTDADSPLLTVQGLKKHFDQSEGFLDRLVGDTGEIRAVDGVNIHIEHGKTLGIVGESGCGKSTLARTILNLETPTAGTIKYQGTDITGLSGQSMRPYRRKMQMVFQDPLASLNPRQTVGDIVKAPLEVHDIGDSDDERTERTRELLERVGLNSGHIDRYPHQFSGGQQQRIGIARALAVEPELIVADEPTSALDVSIQAKILNLLGKLQKKMDLGLLFISHDLSVVRQVADRVAVMYLGEIVESGPVERLFDDPQHPYTQSLLSAVPRIDPAHRTDRVVLRGSVPSSANPPSACRFHTRCPVVIPPDGWTADEETFRAAFSFRTRVLQDDLDPEAARARLESEGQEPSEENVATYLIGTVLDVDPSALPDDVASTVDEAAHALATGNNERATQVVADEPLLTSPCEQETPKSVPVSDDHSAACHRVSPSSTD